ncbi:MAG: hypothetical protein PHX78_12485 [bacterium]|nr:hypothetical protein [bacterium]
MKYEFEHLPVTPDECPISKIFTVGESVYTYEFRHNERFDFYVLTIKDAEDKILYITKLVYAGSVVHAVVEDLEIDYDIYPVNLDDLFTPFKIQDQTVNEDNLDSRVRLYIDNVTTL